MLTGDKKKAVDMDTKMSMDMEIDTSMEPEVDIETPTKNSEDNLQDIDKTEVLQFLKSCGAKCREEICSILQDMVTADETTKKKLTPKSSY